KEEIAAALTHLAGLVNTPVKHLLLVEDNANERQSIIELIGNHDVETTAVGSAKEALAALRDREFNCMVLDLGLPDMTGFDLLQKIKRQREYRGLPIIVYTG